MATKGSYAKHSTVQIGDPAAFIASATNGEWVSTVINPSKTGGMTQLALFYSHIGVWVVALVLAGITNFGASSFMSNSSNASTDADGNPTGAITYDAYMGTSNTTTTIGIIGGIFSILGVVALLVGAAMFDAPAFKEQVWLNVLIQFLTLYGTSATLYIFCQAASKPENGYFWLSLFASIFMLYAQVLLYCTSATLDVMALPRAFIPSLGASVQFISALAISSGDFAPEATDSQKVIAWLVPILTLVSVALMVGIRRYTRDGQGVSQLGEFPFLRSLVLMPFLSSAVLSVYKLSFVKLDPDPTSYVFAFFGMLLNFTIVSVVFVPGSVSANAMDQ